MSAKATRSVCSLRGCRVTIALPFPTTTPIEMRSKAPSVSKNAIPPAVMRKESVGKLYKVVHPTSA
eukprot:3574436-Heterocapsa_arctica.AAC.1